ncbi:MAG: GNAT family N-acetyltransferase [Firmicutes bacterium]|nr:GNAT family N-acetyltransferase [Bacillota bacterium]
MSIRPLGPGEEAPMDLLLLADPSSEIVQGYLGRGKVYVCAEADAILGVYVLLSTRPETIELVNVAVAPERQGQGLGKRMVLHAIETAKRTGCSTIEVGTGNSGVGQLAFYQKCGFRITGVDLDFFVRHYPGPIVENGIVCRDMIRLRLDCDDGAGRSSPQR